MLGTVRAKSKINSKAPHTASRCSICCVALVRTERTVLSLVPLSMPASAPYLQRTPLRPYDANKIIIIIIIIPRELGLNRPLLASANILCKGLPSLIKK